MDDRTMIPVPVPTKFAVDRTIQVPAGCIVRSGYVDVFKVRFACRDRMAVGDIDRAYQKRLQLGDAQSWPPPTGRWVGDEFELYDGRHEALAAIALGNKQILVAWLETVNDE